MRFRGMLVLLAAAALAPAGGVGPSPARAAALTPLHVAVHDTALGSHTVLRARVREVHCGPYGGCRTDAVEGTIVWRLVSRRDPEMHFRHRSVVDNGRARWRTPRLAVRGLWLVRASFSGTEDVPASDARTVLRVTRD